MSIKNFHQSRFVKNIASIIILVFLWEAAPLNAFSGLNETTEETTVSLSSPQQYSIQLAHTQPMTGLEDYALFALNSMSIEENARVLSGDVGINHAGIGPFLESNVELAIGNHAVLSSGTNIRANRIIVKKNAEIYGHIEYNELFNKGIIQGPTSTPLAMPLVQSLPEFLTSVPGTENISLNNKESLTLDPGHYGHLTIKQNSRLIFTGGIYHFKSIDIGSKNRLYFQSSSEIRVSERFDADQYTIIAPEDTLVCGADDIVFYVGGINGKKGSLTDNPKAAETGIKDSITATFYVPNGTFKVRQNSKIRGLFIAKDILISENVNVSGIPVSTGPINQRPTVNAGSDQTITEGETAALTGTVTDDGLPGIPLTIRWSQVSGPGTANVTDSTSAITTALFSQPGTYTLRLTANDGELSAFDEIRVTVEQGNHAPIAEGQSISIDEDASINITLTGTDEDNDTLTYIITLNPEHGTLNGSAPNLTYTPNSNYNGEDHFTFKVNDGQEDSSPADVSITINPINDAPEVDDKTLTIEEDTPASVTLSGSDIDNDPLTFRVTANPEHGTLTGTAPDLTYTPNENYNGEDSFTYTANDSTIDSDPAQVTITITPANDAPIAYAQDVTLNEDDSLNITLTGTDTDEDSLTYIITLNPELGTFSGTAPDFTYVSNTNYHGQDQFVYKVNDGTTDSDPQTISITIAPINDMPAATPQTVACDEDSTINIILSGTDIDQDSLTFTITLNPEHGTLNGSAPNLTYTPDANFNGEDSFTFTANDGAINSDPAVITILVNAGNDAPIAEAQDLQIEEDQTTTITLTGTDIDEDSLTFTILEGPFHGTVEGESPNLTYTPDANYHGDDHFTFRANDGQFDSDPAEVSLTIASINDAPVADAQSLTTNEDNVLDVTLSGSDADNDTLSFSITLNPEHGTLNGSSPNFTYTPDTNFAGIDSFAYQTNDGVINSDPATVIISVQSINDTPIADGQELEAYEDTPIAITLTGSDPENNLLIFIISDSTRHGTLAGTAPNLLYTPDADYDGLDSLIFAVSDSALMSDPATVNITVHSVNDAPVVNAGDDVDTYFGTPILLSGTADDDGLPGGPLTVAWNKISGPGIVSFEDSSKLETIAEFGQPGTYILRLIVNDGELEAYDEISINLTQPPQNMAPTVYAGEDLTVGGTYTTQVFGYVEDDGFPVDGLLQTSWSKVTGTGLVGFASIDDDTTYVSFNEAGRYVLRFTADDGELVVFDEITIQVYPENLPPVADAGADQTSGSGSVQLTGRITDDGKPEGTEPTFHWSKVSGSGDVAFLSPDFAFTEASFSENGTYILELTVGDGEYSAWDSVEVTVSGNRAPMVYAGEDTTLQMVISKPLDSLTTIPQPEAEDEWIYDVGRPGVNYILGIKSLYGIDDELYVSGKFTNAGGEESGCVAMWNGCQWQTFWDNTLINPDDQNSGSWGFPYSYHSYPAVVKWNNHIFIGSYGLKDVDRPSDNLYDHLLEWNGISWGKREFQMMGRYNNYILCLLPTNDGLILGGRYWYQPIDWIAKNVDPKPNIPTSWSITKWNGQSWEMFGNGIRDTSDTEPTLEAIACVQTLHETKDHKIIAGGRFVMETSQGLANNIAIWDGIEWLPMGLGIQLTTGKKKVLDITSDEDGNLYVCGKFSEAGGKPIKNLAKITFDVSTNSWDYNSIGYNSSSYWLTNGLYTVEWHDSSLYIGGDFYYIDNQPKYHVAHWDGTTWHALVNGASPGVNEPVTELESVGDILYMGGNFTQAGGEPANYIVGWGVDQKKSVQAPDSILVENAPVTGKDVEITANVRQKCNESMDITWMVDGVEVNTQILLAGATTDTPQVALNYHFEPGTYMVTLIAEDGQCVPVIANIPVTVTPAVRKRLAGVVSDDGNPYGELSYSWIKEQGPGNVILSHPDSIICTADFDAPGTYLLRLTASDGQYTEFDDIVVQVQLIESQNAPPIVSAGRDISIHKDNPVNLYGLVTDDGLPDTGGPSGNLSYEWALVDGPGPVAFGSPYAVQTTAAFISAGTYVLRLSAEDGELAAFDAITIYVNGQENLPPQVYAGEDFTANITHPYQYTLNDTFSDDGLLYGFVNWSWRKISTPEWYGAFIQGSSENRTVSFGGPGTYHLGLWASDGTHRVEDIITVTVDCSIPDPLVQIDVPFNGATITSPIELIGSASMHSLTSWTLTYAAKDGSVSDVIATSSNSMTDNVLGTFDPTLLLNGQYTITLEAHNSYGLTKTDEIDIVVDGGMKVGNFTVSFMDLSIPVAGIPIQITRTYDSRNKESNDFGTGWTLDIRNVKLQESTIMGEDWKSVRTTSGFFWTNYWVKPTRPHIVTVTTTDGAMHTFDFTLGKEYWQLYPPTVVFPKFEPRPGTTSTLQQKNPQEVIVNGGFSTQWQPVSLIAGLGVFDPSNYILTLKNGIQLEISDIDGLDILRDRNENTLQITENGIIHSSGKSVDFIHDSEGRITTITDPMGNTIDYAYDANNDLVSVTDQESYTTSFTYDDSHYLTEITDPRGITPARQLYDDDGRMIAMVDAEGDTIHMTHNLDQRQEIVKDRLGYITIYTYDNMGNVTSKIDAKGNITTYTYDDHGNKLSETDPDGNSRYWTFDDQDNLLSETDPLGNTTEYTHNERGQMLSKTDPLDNVWTYAYDSEGDKISETLPSGYVVYYAHDSNGNTISEFDDQGDLVANEYDTHGNVLKTTNALGHETFFTYDDNGNQLTQITTRTTPQGVVTMTVTKSYNKKGDVTSVIDPDGHTAFSEYNSLGKLTAKIDKLGRRTEYFYNDKGSESVILYPDSTEEKFIYDNEGNKIQETDREGNVSLYEYDESGEMTKYVAPNGAISIPEYDPNGQISNVTEEGGYVRTYLYDEEGNNTAFINAQGDTTQFGYDERDNQTMVIDAKGNIILNEYDYNDRVIKTIYPDGTFKSFTYDSRGNKIAERDQAGIITRYEYNLMNNLTKVIDALGNETIYEYDEVGNQISQIEANGHTTIFEYDNMSRMVKRILPLGMSEIRVYNAVGNVISLTDFNGNTILFEYNKNNQLIKKAFPDSSIETCTYHPDGSRIAMTDSQGITQYTHDQRNRVLSVTNPDGKFIVYGYDNAGNRTKLIIGADTTRFTYDNLYRLKSAIDSSGQITTYTYDSNGNRESVNYPNGTVAKYTYDNLNRLIKLINKKVNGDTLSCYEYTLGPEGNRTQVVEHTGRIVTYDYDSTYKLIEEYISDPSLGDQLITYEYDNVGNRLFKVDDGNTISYIYDANDRLLTESQELITNTYQYDNNGNTITKDANGVITTYTYDYQNRLIQVDDGVDVIEYTYDMDGIRSQKIVNGNIINYLVDKNRDYSQVLFEYDNSGNPLAKYVHGDDLISQQKNGKTSYYHYDGQMSTRQLTDEFANITDTYTFDSFGQLLNRSGSTDNGYLYTGEQYDPNVGFYYLRSRYYNPTIGRFQTIDTYQGNLFEPASLHKYGYTHQNPVNYTDFSGNFRMTLVGISLTIAIASVLIGIAWPRSKIHESVTDQFEYQFFGGTSFGMILYVGYLHAYIWEKTNKKPEQGEYNIWLIGLGGSWTNGFSWSVIIGGSPTPFETFYLKDIRSFQGPGTIVGIEWGRGLGVLGLGGIRMPDGTIIGPGFSVAAVITWGSSAFVVTAIWKLFKTKTL